MTNDRVASVTGTTTPAHPIVVLTGFMGSGKTSAGEALAELLGWKFVDLDHVIEIQEGLAIRTVFAQRGEPEFRAIEHVVLRDCLGHGDQPTVVALGGGAIVQANNAALLQQSRALVVFLETPIEQMLQRCGVETEVDPNNPRPLAADAKSFRALYEARLPHYRAAHLTINTAGKSVAEVAREVADWVTYAVSQKR